MQIFMTIGVLCALSGILAALLLIAEKFLADYGECNIDINNGEKELKIQGGASLLSSLTEEKVFLPSACGGRGSCGFCKCKVTSGGGPVLPTETPYLSDEDLKDGVRLSCQVKVKNDLAVRIPEELLNVREFHAMVEKITDLTHDIKGLRFSLPEGETIKFKAGQYMQLVAPPYEDVHDETYRAYSISSPPSDEGVVELVIRLVPEGIVTTYVFEHLKEGAPVRLMGPFGDFYLRPTERDCIFIAGGSGFAPFRSMLYDMEEKGIRRKTTFFFGARTERDLYYLEEMAEFQKRNDWFRFVPALSGRDLPEDLPYEKGVITDIVKKHFPDTSEMEGYLCGSPGMIDACDKVLTGGGMPLDRIYYDKFS